jgi:hypothetical protein
MIYSVVPSELGDEAFQRLVDHYRDNPNITVIQDRRHSERRANKGATGDHGEKRETRERRRRKLPGEQAV